MKRGLHTYIADMLDSVSAIDEYTKGAAQKEFLKNKQMQDAVARRLEVIGEASKNIPADVKRDYPDVPWKEIAGMRDVLIHSYFGINMERIWKTVEEDLPPLKKALKDMKNNPKAKA